MAHPVQQVADLLARLDRALAAIHDEDLELFIDALATASARITAQHRGAALRLIEQHLSVMPNVSAVAVARDVEGAYAVIGWFDREGAVHTVPLYSPSEPISSGEHEWWSRLEALVDILEALDESDQLVSAKVLGHDSLLLRSGALTSS